MAKLKRESPLADQEIDKQCIWKTNGYQCQANGTTSPATHGGGPWYCSEHFYALVGRRSGTEDPAVMAKIDARVNKIVPRREDEPDWSRRCKAHVLAFVRDKQKQQPHKDWARRILSRNAAGEQMPMISVRFAEDVARVGKTVGREPGEDEQEAA